VYSNGWWSKGYYLYGISVKVRGTWYKLKSQYNKPWHEHTYVAYCNDLPRN